jgi:alkaline phosphatase
MTDESTELPSKNASGFFLMVEGGKIDHALHDSNANNALEEAVDVETMVMNGYPKRGNPILGVVQATRPPPALSLKFMATRKTWIPAFAGTTC